MKKTALAILWGAQAALERLAEQASEDGLSATQAALEAAWKCISKLRMELENSIDEERIH